LCVDLNDRACNAGVVEHAAVDSPVTVTDMWTEPHTSAARHSA